MDKLHVFALHRIVGGLKPGALPHEESVWCRLLQASDEAQRPLPDTELPSAADAPTRQIEERQTR